MGLDTVELVIEVEQAFGLEIPDEDAQRIVTVGDLVRYVRSKVGPRPGSYCLTSRTFYRFRRALMRTLPLARQQIRPEGNLETLIPARDRRRVWARLSADGFVLPPLHLSGAVLGCCAMMAVVPAVGLAWCRDTNDSLVLAVPLFCLALLAAKPWAIHPDPHWTIREAVLYLTPTPCPSAEPQAILTDDEIAGKVRMIISEQLDVPIDRLTDEARFIEDLGAS